jgi:hypothetical protein
LSSLGIRSLPRIPDKGTLPARTGRLLPVLPGPANQRPDAVQDELDPEQELHPVYIARKWVNSAAGRPAQPPTALLAGKLAQQPVTSPPWSRAGPGLLPSLAARAASHAIRPSLSV